MSYTGKTFTRDDAEQMLGKATMRRLRSRLDAAAVDARLVAEAARLTEKFRVVAMDGDRPVIAEEMTERIVRRLGEVGRPAALDLLKLPADVRVAVLAAFDPKTGDLINTLDPIKGA